MDLSEQARRDPRVGDKWVTSDLAKIPVEITSVEYSADEPWIRFKYDGTPNALNPTSFQWFIGKGWTLVERGPAPAVEPNKTLHEWLDHADKLSPEARERDPRTTPVVGDKWGRDGDHVHIGAINDGWIHMNITYECDGICRPVQWPIDVFAEDVTDEAWHLIAKGDDPSWRPAPTQSEKPPAGIKVGDRVRLAPVGEMGNVTSKDDYGVKILFDGDTKPQTFSHRDVEHWLTIIPPAADASTDDEPPTPAPYESVNHPPHYGGDSPHEVIKFIEAHDLGFNAGNVVKYVVRAGRKPGEDKVKDLEKAVWYLNRIVAAAKGTA